MVRGITAPSRTREQRLSAARAVLPIPPDALVPVLAFLSADADEEVRALAARSLRELPESLLIPVLKSGAHEAVLDACARALYQSEEAIEAILLNSHTHDDTFRYVAAMGSGKALEIISRNQIRAMRFPPIVEALYYNPNMRMGPVQDLLELAVREGVALEHMPGFKEIKAAILGEQKEAQRLHEAAKEEAAAARQLEADELMALANAADQVEKEGQGEGLDEDDFGKLLEIVTTEGEGAESTLQAPEESRSGKALWRIINKLSVPQKIRLALMGDAGARAMLVRDTKKVVALAVMRSPRLTTKEVAGIARNRASHEEIVGLISRNREWTRIYPVMLALVYNPKTPPVMLMGFVRSLHHKDQKDLSKSKDVPAFVQRLAKSLVDQRDRSGKA